MLRRLVRLLPLASMPTYSAQTLTQQSKNMDAYRVETAHSFTGRMCAASRWEETRRPDSLFVDNLGAKLGNQESASALGIRIRERASKSE